MCISAAYGYLFLRWTIGIYFLFLLFFPFRLSSSATRYNLYFTPLTILFILLYVYKSFEWLWATASTTRVTENSPALICRRQELTPIAKRDWQNVIYNIIASWRWIFLLLFFVHRFSCLLSFFFLVVTRVANLSSWQNFR